MSGAGLQPPPDDEQEDPNAPPADPNAAPPAGGAPPAAPPAPDAGAPAPDDGGPQQGDSVGGEDQKPNATPEQQKEYNDFVNACQIVIYSTKAGFAKFVQALRVQCKNDPVGTLAKATVMVLRRVATSGRHFSTEVIFHGGIEVLQDIAMVCQIAKAHTFTPKEIEAAIYKATDSYRVQAAQAGEIDQNEAKQEWEQMKQADASGDLAKAFPDVEQHFQDGAQFYQKLDGRFQQQQGGQQQQPPGGAPPPAAPPASGTAASPAPAPAAAPPPGPQPRGLMNGG